MMSQCLLHHSYIVFVQQMSMIHESFLHRFVNRHAPSLRPSFKRAPLRYEWPQHFLAPWNLMGRMGVISPPSSRLPLDVVNQWISMDQDFMIWFRWTTRRDTSIIDDAWLGGKVVAIVGRVAMQCRFFSPETSKTDMFLSNNYSHLFGIRWHEDRVILWYRHQDFQHSKSMFQVL